jgi:superfamily II DNA helicase RecQ
MLVRNARILRASTIRPQHRYHVQRCTPDTLFDTAVDIGRRQARHLEVGHKAVVYCLSRTTCEQLAAELSCEHYHAHRVDRAEVLSRWHRTGGFIVATSALGTGVDFPGIVFILHMDMPWGMIDFTQEVGRGGRGGERVDSIILVEEGVVERKVRRGGLSLDASAMAAFITSRGCRREVMSRYLDGEALARRCMAQMDWARCDRCGEGAHENVERDRRDMEMWSSVRQALDEMVTGCVWC